MIENENTEEEIEQWTENHRAAVAIYWSMQMEVKKKEQREKEEKKIKHIY